VVKVLCYKSEGRWFDPEWSVRRLAGCGVKSITPETNTALGEIISMEELRHTIIQGKANKAPGQDGICLEFFGTAWDVIKHELLTIMNHMYIGGNTSVRQRQGLIVCLPKTPHPKNFDDYRPLTLLNTDYKIMARIIANRIRLCLAAIHHPNQHCGVQGNSVYEAVGAVRETVINAEVTKTPLCIVSIDFSEAFDKISHTHLLANGFNEWFQQRIMGMYDKAALARGAWNTPIRIMDMPYGTDATILGLHFINNVNTSAHVTWSTVTTRVRALAQDTHYRGLSLDRRIRFVHVYLLAKIWYVALIYPPPADCLRQLNTTISWFIWRGDIFRIPLTTLQRGKADGGGIS